ncbi:tRNA (adenosine(37)-N6)-threonylcarbamoyltransferase complex ATPase subunit type 1 TsaE [Bacteroidota bacterium]
MVFPNKIRVNSESETIEVAVLLAGIIQPSDVIALNGNLGAGKTFLVKNICKKFGINNVSSPSFAIVNEYIGSRKFYHFDFYRINKIVELYDIGFEEYLNDIEAAVFIEWADRLPAILPDNRYQIDIEILNEGSREITINKHE